MIRPYTFEFFRAVEPFFEIIIYSMMDHKILEQISSHFEKILNGPVKEYL
jgi:hypothetical protein